MDKLTLDSASIMQSHPKITLLVCTGGPGVVKAVLSSGKKAIGAGVGNPPVIVDDTADIKKAGKDIIDGCTFDNNLPCIAEKEVFAFDSIADELIAEMKKNGAYLITKDQADKLIPIVRVHNIEEAIDLAVKAEHGNRHTAHMHSKNVGRLSAFAKAFETTIFVKNAPSYAGVGFGGEGHTTFTIAGPTGEGITSARSFTRKRRCVMAENFRII